MDEVNQTSQSPQPTNPTPTPLNHSSGSKLIPIIFGVVAITLVSIGAYALGAKQAEAPVLYPAQTTPIPTTASVDETANWKTYSNIKYGYSVKYPDTWFVSGISAEAGAVIIPCSESNTNTNIVEFSKIKLKDCGFIGEQLPSSDAELTIWVLDKPWEKEEIITTDATGKDISQNIVVAGEKATKTPFTEKSELPNTQATRVYFNHNSKGYLMFLKQTDNKGNYDPAFDQILSTFQFTQ